MVRLFVLAVLVGLSAWSAPAAARPTVAVAPIRGDSKDQVADIVVSVLSDSAKVVKPKAVLKAIARLGISGELDARDARKLQKKLDADAVVQGRVRRKGKRNTLRLTVYVKGKKPDVIEIELRSKRKLRDGVRESVVTLIDDDDDDDRKRKKKRVARDDDDDDDDAKKDRKKRKKRKRVAREDDDDDDEKKDRKKRKKRKRVARDDDDDDDEDDDDDGGELREERDDDDLDDEGGRRRRLAMVRVDAGTYLGVRRLTYSAAMPPPRLGTFGTAARIEGALYPFAGKPGAAAGFGIAGELEKTLGLAIQIPGGPSVPIDQAHYSIGARYRVAAGKATTVAFGLDFAKRRYVADRTGLASPTALDAPDVDYSAVAPGVALRTPVARSVALFAGLGAYLILDTGPIQDKDSFGAATVYGGELAAGLDVAFSQRLGLRLAGELTQINFKFKGNGMQSSARGITAAVDRSFGVAATLAVKY